MMRSSVAFGIFLALAILQTSFLASLPGILAYLPLVVAGGVYLVQHAGERTGALWIAGFGLFLWMFSLSSFPLEVASYAAAGIVAHLSARRLFSNRSWYGLIACGLFSTLALNMVRALVLAVVAIRRPERVSWAAFGDTLLWNVLLMVVLLSVLFAFARQIRLMLRV